MNQSNILSFLITPELITRIYKEVKKAFLRKDGKPFKREKKFWIKNLIKIIAENLNIDKEIVEITINKLIGYGLLIKDYKDEVYYYPEFEESMKALNGIKW